MSGAGPDHGTRPAGARADDDGPAGGLDDGAEDLPVIFISGKGRSGSTMLAMVLGELDGVTNGGELRFVWRRGMQENRRCGCGLPFVECPVWSTVTAQLADGADEGASLGPRGRASAAGHRGEGDRHWGDDGVDVDQVVTAHDRLFRWPAIPSFLLRRASMRRSDAVADWAPAAGHLYRSLADVTGGSAIVDSSKWPADPAMLGLVPGIRPVVVHLLRDPRAVAWSWQRSRPQYDLDEVREMDRFGPLHSSLSWMARNVVVSAVTRRWKVPRLVLRYEDVVADPAAAVRQIADRAGLTVDTAPAIDGRSVQRSVNHTVAGNPARFGAGPLELSPDDEWRTSLPRHQRLLITAVTAPLLRRYGYNLRTHA